MQWITVLSTIGGAAIGTTWPSFPRPVTPAAMVARDSDMEPSKRRTMARKGSVRELGLGTR